MLSSINITINIKNQPNLTSINRIPSRQKKYQKESLHEHIRYNMLKFIIFHLHTLHTQLSGKRRFKPTLLERGSFSFLKEREIDRAENKNPKQTAVYIKM